MSQMSTRMESVTIGGPGAGKKPPPDVAPKRGYPGQPGQVGYPGQASYPGQPGQPGQASYPGQVGSSQPGQAGYPGQRAPAGQGEDDLPPPPPELVDQSYQQQHNRAPGQCAVILTKTTCDMSVMLAKKHKLNVILTKNRH